MPRPVPVSPADDSGHVVRLNSTKKTRRKTERRRAQCCRNQARYRAKQHAYAQALEATVTQLRNTIHELLARRQELSRCLERDEPASRLIVTLYDVMRHGLTHDESRPRQLAFLATTHRDNVCMDGEHGRAAVVQQWRLFSNLWSDLTLKLCHLECVFTGDSYVTMRQAVRLQLTITRKTVRHVFPHLMASQNHDIFEKLVGQRLVCDATAIHVVNSNDQIIEVAWTIDFVGALQSFLSIYDVARVMEGARIKRDAYLIEPTVSESPAHQRFHRYPPGRRFAHLEVEEQEEHAIV